MRAKLLISYLGWCLLAQAIVFNASSADAEIEQGRKLAAQCKTCHGSHGLARIPIAPNIAGEPLQYIINQLEAFRSGQREHEMMSVVTKSLDDESIRLLANWFASQTINVKIKDDTTADSAINNCVECHGIDGLATAENTPHLAAESVIYIDTQLKAFRSGKRTHEVMSKIASELTDDQIRKVSEWYSAISLEVVK